MYRTTIASILLLIGVVGAGRAGTTADGHEWPPDPKRYEPNGTEIAPGLKIGDTLGRENAAAAAALLPPDILGHYQEGQYSNPIVSWPEGLMHFDKSFEDATRENPGKYALAPGTGTIVEKATGKQPKYIYGLPFPDLQPNDPEAGLKAVWNQFYAWWLNGNVYADTLLIWLSPNGIDRQAGMEVRYQFFDGQPPKYRIPNPQNYQVLGREVVLNPADLEGTIALGYRFRDPGKRDQSWAYVPALRRVRAVSPSNRSDGFLGSDLSQDDAQFFDGKPEDFEWLCTVGEFLGNRYPDLLCEALGRGRAGRPIAGLPDLEAIVLLRGAGPGTLAWRDFLVRGEGIPADEARRAAREVSPDDLSDILFTSGTTGAPKGVMTTHGQNLRVFATWSEIVGLSTGDRYLVVNPFFHGFGYKAGWLAAIMRGATILPHAVFDVPAVLARIAAERVSVLPGPPTLYQSILAHPERERYDLSSLRLAVTGAAVVPVELVHRMRRELTFRTVLTAYGLTESSGVVTMCRADDDPETIATTSGRAIPGVEVRCVDGEGCEVPRGQPGEILVRGYNVMRGYLDDPEATAEAIDAEGWLHTGDIGVMDERGYLRITDRLKDMFIVGGFNCYPAEIENLMLRNPAVAQAAVIGVPDARLGEVGMAWVVPMPGVSLTAEDVIAWCREHMANYKVPRRVEVVSVLPTNAAGKVTKFVLRERAAERCA